MLIGGGGDEGGMDGRKKEAWEGCGGVDVARSRSRSRSRSWHLELRSHAEPPYAL